MAEMDESEISDELRNVTLKMQQLVERKKMLFIMKELMKRVDRDSPGEKDSISGDEMHEENEQELNSIDEKLNQLEVIRAELQRRQDQNKDNQKPKEVCFSPVELPSSSPVVSPEAPQQKPPISVEEPFDISTLAPPPNYPAPEITKDYSNFQSTPIKTQCPNCSNYITTKTSSTVSSITWLVCSMTAMMGCVAGCCLIPFCLDSFKSTSHKCPKCDTLITTAKKL